MACYARRRRWSLGSKGKVRSRRAAACESQVSRASSKAEGAAACDKKHAAAQLGPFVEALTVQTEQLREDHHALCDCLCAAGLLTLGELAKQRQLRLCAARFHGFCRTPAWALNRGYDSCI
ncbi:unnamed protein product [Polarella glacialis]|uniref:Uncharacterized protein n=1 Tax=Polarella glacialis TaxID=89957 RepID=A0A813LE24_POLGL|nr:unnamed protein product [Polarella glacialis]